MSIHVLNSCICCWLIYKFVSKSLAVDCVLMTGLVQKAMFMAEHNYYWSFKTEKKSRDSRSRITCSRPTWATGESSRLNWATQQDQENKVCGIRREKRRQRGQEGKIKSKNEKKKTKEKGEYGWGIFETLIIEIVSIQNICKIVLKSLLIPVFPDSMTRCSLEVPRITSSVFHITAGWIKHKDSHIKPHNSCLTVFMYSWNSLLYVESLISP